MTRCVFLLALLAAGCRAQDVDTAVGAPVFTFAEPEDAPPLRGPGGPQVDFAPDQLFENCAYLTGGPEDAEHHNTVAGYRGHLILPWAPEWSRGGYSIFEVADPCNPVKVADSFFQTMRETHATGFVHLRDGEFAGDWSIATHLLGMMTWNLDDPAAPYGAAALDIEGIFYPDAYARVVFSVFMQYPWAYVAGADNGIFVIDIHDPTNPVVAGSYSFEPNLRAGMVHVLGNRMLVISAEQTEAALLDVSDPTSPQLYGGGRFTITDAEGNPREAYAGGMVGDMALFARKDGGGGVIIYDVADPTRPTYRTEYHLPEGNGGYVFWHEGYAFEGNSHTGDIIDFTDLDNPVYYGQGLLEGDLDTFTPFGNVAILAVDDEAAPGWVLR